MPFKGLRCLAPKTSRFKITIWYAFWNTDEINYILGSEPMEPIHPEVPQQMRGECLNAYFGSNRKPRFPSAPGPRALTGPSSRAGLPQMTGQRPPGWQLLDIILLEAILCKMYGSLLVGFSISFRGEKGHLNRIANNCWLLLPPFFWEVGIIYDPSSWTP
jgi:hypothetical protein